MRRVMDMDSAQRHHHFLAQRLEAQALCHRVLSEDEQMLDVAEKMMEHSHKARGGLNALDAALQALQQKHGRMEDAAAWAYERSRDEMGVMCAALACRRVGLRLVESRHEASEPNGDSMHISYTVMLLETPTVKDGWLKAHRDVLRRMYDAGLVTQARRCQHAHDCCGHWYPSTPGVQWVERNLFEVVQSHYQNV